MQKVPSFPYVKRALARVLGYFSAIFMDWNSGQLQSLSIIQLCVLALLVLTSPRERSRSLDWIRYLSEHETRKWSNDGGGGGGDWTGESNSGRSGKERDYNEWTCWQLHIWIPGKTCLLEPFAHEGQSLEERCHSHRISFIIHPPIL
jgi:hypothetical protein